MFRYAGLRIFMTIYVSVYADIRVFICGNIMNNVRRGILLCIPVGDFVETAPARHSSSTLGSALTYPRPSACSRQAFFLSVSSLPQISVGRRLCV